MTKHCAYVTVGQLYQNKQEQLAWMIQTHQQ